jgi:hypothetical protein
MKWVQLDADYSDDPKICQLSREWGSDTARSFWPMLLGFVTEHMEDRTARVSISPIGPLTDVYMAKRLHTNPALMRKRLLRCVELGLIQVYPLDIDLRMIGERSPNDLRMVSERSENDLRMIGERSPLGLVIFIPKMLKRLVKHRGPFENAAQKSPLEIEVDIKKKEIEERNRTLSRFSVEGASGNPLGFVDQGTSPSAKNPQTPAIPEDAFDLVWAMYPVKDGRKSAQRHFSASVTTEKDLADCVKALQNYLGHLAIPGNGWKKPKSGSTWFNNWQDWTEWQEPPNLGLENGNGNGTNSRDSHGNAAAAGANSKGVRSYTPKQ